ncbi:hypothetical protein, partial [Escherichia coli]|uniref:hypothetical protein n=1 Tax=Escherichia coli TaxID=562 RepID=UPI003CE49F7C
PDTNLTYAVKYLAGAYQAAGGNHNRAVAYYAGGYYYAAKRQGLLPRQQVQAQAEPSITLFDANAQELPRRTRRHRH